MIGQFFHSCSCFPEYHADVINIGDDWHEDTLHGLETEVSLIWNTDTPEFTCIENYAGNLHLPIGNSYHQQLVILLKGQNWKQRFVGESGSIADLSASISHQTTHVGLDGYYDFSLATDDVLKNVIVMLDFNEELGIWQGETDTAFGGETLSESWNFEFHPDLGVRYFFGESSALRFEILIEPLNEGDIILGRYELDENCNVIGEQAAATLPEFMQNRPKEYLLVLDEDITYTGTIDGTAYTDEVVMAAGEYPFEHRCLVRNTDCTSSPAGFQLVFGDCLCEPYNFTSGQSYGTRHHYLPASPDCNDPDEVSISWGSLVFEDGDFVSLYFGVEQGWSGGEFAYADWNIKTYPKVDFYGDTLIEPKLNESSPKLTMPSEAIIRFNGFGL